MGRNLITGRGGTGKTSICRLLFERGFTAFDGDDIPGFARAEDMHGKPIEVDWSGFIDYSKVAFNWQQHNLRNFLAAHPHVFLCGSASNQLTFHKFFDQVFVLTLDRATHQRRLLDRESEYGKNPATMTYLLDEQPHFARQAIALGATTIDASGSPDQTVDLILEDINDLAAMARPSD
jgi:dephospho-CoA kinase